MPKEIEVILFDIGGVLVELTGVPTMLSWTQDSMTADQLWAAWLSSPAVRAFETGRISAADFAEGLVAEMSLPVSPDEFINEFTFWPRGLFPGAVELVKRISPAYTLATLSNTNALHWPRFMDEMALANLFQHYFASHLIGKLKPDPDVFEHVLESLDCDSSSVLFIDDNMLNVDAATAMGIQAKQARGILGAEQVLVEYGVIG